MKKMFFGAMVFLAFLVLGCKEGAARDESPGVAAPRATRGEGKRRVDEMGKIEIKIGDKIFAASLEDNEAARALAEKLPLDVTMMELNGNEKYYRFSSSFPTNDACPGNIRAGDLMLYGGSYVVLFYKDFPTDYRYTRLGRLDDPVGLAKAVGEGDVKVFIKAR